MIETGTVLQQRYKIDKQIGQGGMGAVYVATDQRFGSTVAIKETLCMDDSFRKAIEREARLLNSLKHSALPKVTDHFEENGIMFLVMEYIPGEDLCCVLDERGKPFPVNEMVKWGDQLLDALDYLHHQEIPVIHRDIKPQNLKLTPQGQVILLDFGLAKGNPSDVSHQTAAKSIFGYSRSYASLEQIQGTGTDPRSDLYSLAATLYHLLTGVAPEDALTRAMSVLSQKPDPLAPANSINPEVPRGIAGVLQKAMDLNASERPNSAAEMRQMLRESENYAYLAESATFAHRISDPQVFAQPTRLMPEGTKPIFSDPNAKTEVLPGFGSQVTSVRADGSEQQTNVVAAPLTSVPPAKGRGLGVAAGALMVLLVGVVVAGGIYLAKPSVFGINNDSGKTGDTGTTVPVTADSTVTSNPSNATATSSAQNVPEGEANTAKVLTEDVRPAAPEKPAETTKNVTKATGSTKANNTSNPDDTVMDVQIDDHDIPRGGVVLTDRDENGKVTTLRVNPTGPPPNGQRPPPNGGPYPFLPPNFDLRKLTPAQRQKLQRVLRNNPQMRPPIPPKPEN
ncbi:MAG: serine/threonine-protein kinase [Pyrinomonadaceae bacterium]